MIVKRISVTNFRNIIDTEIQLKDGLNVFCGDNGAGKTSVLESIHFLSHVRSFKTKNSRHLINHDAKYFRLVSDISENDVIQHVGMEKYSDKFLASINGERITKPSAVADILPTISLHPEVFSLLNGDPSEKRAYLDWGVFYGNENFKLYWRRYQQALKQRNAALRNGATKQMVACWNDALAENGEKISSYREKYLLRIAQRVPALTREFIKDTKIDLRYIRGWPKDIALHDHLIATLDSDFNRGFTQSGPQRGGFKTFLNGHETTQVASRGQLKILTLILKLAQAIEFFETGSRRCVLLLDDIDAELDLGNFNRFLGIVDALGLQTLLTTLSHEKLGSNFKRDSSVFHVEHGEIKQVL